MTPALSVRELCSSYGRIPVINGATLEISVGEFVGVFGHNGMGKTTLLRTVMGYIPASSGEIEVMGQDMTHQSTTARARRGVGYVPQGREIFSSLTVYENLRMGCLGNPVGEQRAIEEAVASFPRLKDYLNRLGGALSGGEQQLLALARCLCGDPKLLLLDEPTEGIQPSIVEEIAESLAAIGRSRGLAMLLVEQNLGFITTLCSRILILQKGVIAAETTAESVRDATTLHRLTGLA